MNERLGLGPGVVEELHAALPAVAERTMAALTDEVPAYGEAALGTEMAATIQGALELALGTFLRVATAGDDADPAFGYAPVLEAAYGLGRGEARSGRSMEALLAAYRVGARVAWQHQAELLVRRGVAAATVAEFAQLVFSYIDQLSGASAAGHRDELATSGRVREQLLDRLAATLLGGATSDDVAARAERAAWALPDTLTVVVLRAAHLGHVVQLLDARTLALAGDLAPGLPSEDLAVLLVPDAHRSRAALRSSLTGRGAVIGPTRPCLEAAASYRRVLRALEVLPDPGDEPLDTEDHLVTLVVAADGEALEDLRSVALRPLAGLRPAAAERLAETLRSWLLHQGRRDEVAAALNVHPQTVRYRMTQVRELYGERLNDPETALALTIALSRTSSAPP